MSKVKEMMMGRMEGKHKMPNGKMMNYRDMKDGEMKHKFKKKYIKGKNRDKDWSQEEY